MCPSPSFLLLALFLFSIPQGEWAFRANNKKFLTALPGQRVHAQSEGSGDGTRFHVLSCAERNKHKRQRDGYEVAGTLTGMEADFCKKFQSWRDGKEHLPEQDKGALVRARKDGSLHEELLNRREKQKADRYCK